MNSKQIQTELATTLDFSKKVYRMNHDDQYLIDFINELSPSVKEKVYEIYKNASGIIKDIRRIVATKIRNEKLTLAFIQKLVEKRKKEKPRSFSQYKSLYSILYPIALKDENDKRYTFFNQQLFPEIQSALNIINESTVKYFDFGGERQFGSERIWFAIYNKNQPHQSKSKQLFFNLHNGIIKASLYDFPNKKIKYEKEFHSIEPTFFDDLLEIYNKGKEEILQDIPTMKYEEIFLDGARLYKMSHGSFIRKKFQNALSIITNNNWITLHKSTGKNQATHFKESLSKGDYVYITIGAKKLSSLARIKSEKWGEVSAEITNEEGWIYREIDVLKPPENNAVEVDSREHHFPSGNSTLGEIKPEKLNEANQKLFQPAYNVTFKMGTATENQEKMAKTDNIYPLNTILFGPPGTGKTYVTKELAVKIIEGKNPDNRIVTNEKSKSYFDKKQIQFVTFHQSMNYEDFVEGIKPNLNNDEDDALQYQIEDGIFKRMCVLATYDYIKAQKKQQSATKTLTFNQLYGEVLNDIQEKLDQNEVVVIPLKAGGDVEVKEITRNGNFKLQHIDGSRSYTISRNRTEKLYNEIEDFGNIPNIYSYFRSIIGGSNASAYWAILNQIYQTTLQDITTIIDEKEVDYDAKRKAFERINWQEIDCNVTVNNYILIIDEINRGNVSAILGELITLIETDKRGGNKETIEVTLPYSKKTFSVPPNLYIIGTMNTADRSVEALDTALRRRFSFVELAPNPTLITPEKLELGDELDGINHSKLLATINQRIRKLIDKDHRIGHAYFMRLKYAEDPVTTLREIFQNKILPLLQEYFYGNFGKIQLVIGKYFISKVEDENIRFAESDIEDYNLSERTVYEIKNLMATKNGQYLVSDEAFVQAVKKIYE